MLHDYSRKAGVIHAEILLPANAPAAYQERGILWNAVEQSEKNKNAQLAREVEIALPVELERDEQIRMVQEYVTENFVSQGMCADIAIHEKHNDKHPNPHAHIMLTMRPIQENGEFVPKSKKEYILDENGNKQYDPIKRSYKCRKIRTTNWDSTDFLQGYRQAWADKINALLEQKGISEKVSPLSYKEQNIEQIPAIHLGHACNALEKQGIETIRGNRNREIQKLNQEKTDPLKQIFASGTKQEAIEYLAGIRNLYAQYVFQDMDIDKTKDKLQERIQSVKFELRGVKKDLAEIDSLVQERAQEKENRAKLKPYQFLKQNESLNKSLKLKARIEEKAQQFEESWDCSPKEAPETMRKIESNIALWEQNLSKYPENKSHIAGKIQESKRQFQKNMLLTAAHYGLKRIEIIRELPRIQTSEVQKSIKNQLYKNEYDIIGELNDFRYNEIKNQYTPEEQKKIESFLAKIAETEKAQKLKQKQEKKDHSFER